MRIQTPHHIKENCSYHSLSYILYPIVQRNHWFANSDVPFQATHSVLQYIFGYFSILYTPLMDISVFQSVTNDLLHSQFVMQINICATSGGCYI